MLALTTTLTVGAKEKPKKMSKSKNQVEAVVETPITFNNDVDSMSYDWQ